MQSAGHAAAHSEQPTHFSRPVSSKRCRRWRPRKRGETGVFSSGDWMGVGPAHHLDDVAAGVVRSHVATTTIAVTSAFSVASGRSTFHPNAISWS